MRYVLILVICLFICNVASAELVQTVRFSGGVVTAGSIRMEGGGGDKRQLPSAEVQRVILWPDVTNSAEYFIGPSDMGINDGKFQLTVSHGCVSLNVRNTDLIWVSSNRVRDRIYFIGEK